MVIFDKKFEKIKKKYINKRKKRSGYMTELSISFSHHNIYFRIFVLSRIDSLYTPSRFEYKIIHKKFCALFLYTENNHVCSNVIIFI